MMFNRFTKSARVVVAQAHAEATTLGSAAVEAEHLVLALVGQPALEAVGLDRDAILRALDDEFEQSLAAVGVSAGALGVPATAAVAHAPRFGTSAKVALERSLEEALARGDRHIGPEHILLAVLRPDLGTLARALECAGVKRGALYASI